MVRNAVTAPNTIGFAAKRLTSGFGYRRLKLLKADAT